MDNEVQKTFEQRFQSDPFHLQVEQCERYELAEEILDLFRNNYPVLESGCGSGKWNAYLRKYDIPNFGFDWSQKLCARAKEQIPGNEFISGDLQNLPFKDNSFDGILALGSIEHTISGPEPILKEFHRVLKKDGKALITVPYCGHFKSFLKNLKKPLKKFRNIIKKKTLNKPELKRVSEKACKKWHPVFKESEDGFFFYQYEFNHKQMRNFLNSCGFRIEKEFVAFGDDGLVYTFGKIAGKWKKDIAGFEFNPLGVVLKKLIPSSAIGHMLCYVIRNK